MTTVGEWLAAQGKLHVSDPAATARVEPEPYPRAGGRDESRGDAAFKEASAKFGASTAAATAAKEQPPPEPHPQETFQKVAGPLITHIVDGVKTTLPADEFRARRDGTAPTPPARLHDPDAKYPGKVLNDGMVQIAGPIWGCGFNAAEANAMAAAAQDGGRELEGGCGARRAGDRDRDPDQADAGGLRQREGRGRRDNGGGGGGEQRLEERRGRPAGRAVNTFRRMTNPFHDTRGYLLSASRM